MDGDRISASRTTLEGKFVQLRPIQLGDAPVTLAWRLGERAALLSDGSKTIEEQTEWIASRPRNELNFIIETLPGTLPLGMISLVDIDFKNRRAEPARFLIGEESLARGVPVAAEALSLLYELAFDTLNLCELYGTMSEDNALMLRWHRYLGAREMGYLPKEVLIDGSLKKLIGIELNEEDYRAVAKIKLDRLKRLGNLESKGEQEYT